MKLLTSSYTLPYSACSLGFPPQMIRNIYGAVKIYDTRVGTDPDFDDDYDKEILDVISNIGSEYGVTTGRKMKVKWLNVNKLLNAINISGCTVIVISKLDILRNCGVYKLFFNNFYHEYVSLEEMVDILKDILINNCKLLQRILFSDNPYNIKNL